MAAYSPKYVVTVLSAAMVVNLGRGVIEGYRGVFLDIVCVGEAPNLPSPITLYKFAISSLNPLPLTVALQAGFLC